MTWSTTTTLQWLYSGLITPVSPRGFAYPMASPTERIEAADVGPWLEQHRLAKPKGAMTVHHLDSHDTNEWGGLMQYRREAFGEQAARALFGFCCSLGGPLMMFQGAEDGAEEFYRRMLRLVNELPALRDGSITIWPSRRATRTSSRRCGCTIGRSSCR